MPNDNITNTHSPDTAESDNAVKTAATMLFKAAMDMYYEDNHYFGERPCSTCRAISHLLGFKFGCYRYRAEKGLKP